MSRSRLVADIGGTNSRFGLSNDGVLATDQIRSYRNDDFADFSEVAAAYQADIARSEVDEVVVAIGGPVSGGRGRLTNRDWHFNTQQLRDVFGTQKAILINDLSAFGYAVHFLDDASLDRISEGAAPSTSSNQALVIGIGTGFNVSPVFRTGQYVFCSVSEYGHLALPTDVSTRLTECLGSAADAFETIEDVFSGRGYKRLRDMCCAERHSPDTLSEQGFQMFYAQLLGHLTRGLLLAFLPHAGIFFSGSVVRNLLATSARMTFVQTLEQPFSLDVDLRVPVASILDDTAALVGCSVYPMGVSLSE